MSTLSNADINKKLCDVVGKENVYIDEPMNVHTSFRTGGPADFFVVPKNGEQIKELIKFANESNIDITLFGNGSNTIVTDKGIRGIVISLKGLNSIEILEDECKMVLGAGVSTIRAANDAKLHSLSGFEFACGIPGSIGGGIFMNAGAYGGEFKDIIDSVSFYLPNEDVFKIFSNEDCKFDYRKSAFQSMDNPIILSCVINLKKGDAKQIHDTMQEFMHSRSEKQPINYPSAGSIFKREEGIIVAKLIDEAGLKGYKIGGAEVSSLHAGFIVNVGNATTKDILDVIDHVKRTVYEKYNVVLHEEVKVIGER